MLRLASHCRHWCIVVDYWPPNTRRKADNLLRSWRQILREMLDFSDDWEHVDFFSCRSLANLSSYVSVMISDTFRLVIYSLTAYCYRKSSVHPSDVPWAYVLDQFESNYTNNWRRAFAPRRHSIGNLAQGKHQQNSGGIGMGSLFSAENLQYLWNGAT